MKRSQWVRPKFHKDPKFHKRFIQWLMKMQSSLLAPHYYLPSGKSFNTLSALTSATQQMEKSTVPCSRLSSLCCQSSWYGYSGRASRKMTGLSLHRWGRTRELAFFCISVVSHMMIDVHLSGCIYGYSILSRYSLSLPVVVNGLVGVVFSSLRCRNPLGGSNEGRLCM